MHTGQRKKENNFKNREKSNCGKRHNERYDSTDLFTVTYQLIYRSPLFPLWGAGLLLR